MIDAPASEPEAASAAAPELARIEAEARAYAAALPLSPEKRAELAAEAVRRAQARLSASGGDAAGRALGEAVAFLRREAAASVAVPLVCPPLSRGHMRPEEMVRRPWVPFFDRLLAPIKLHATESIFSSSQIVILFVLITLALIIFSYFQLW